MRNDDGPGDEAGRHEREQPGEIGQVRLGVHPHQQQVVALGDHVLVHLVGTLGGDEQVQPELASFRRYLNGSAPSRACSRDRWDRQRRCCAPRRSRPGTAYGTAAGSTGSTAPPPRPVAAPPPSPVSRGPRRCSGWWGCAAPRAARAGRRPTPPSRAPPGWPRACRAGVRSATPTAAARAGRRTTARPARPRGADRPGPRTPHGPGWGRGRGSPPEPTRSARRSAAAASRWASGPVPHTATWSGTPLVPRRLGRVGALANRAPVPRSRSSGREPPPEDRSRRAPARGAVPASRSCRNPTVRT